MDLGRQQQMSHYETPAITATIQKGDQSMAAAISRRLGATVTFLRWQATGVAGQQEPVFCVPDEHVMRAAEFGLDARQFVGAKR
jgi:hypothetical protein